MQTVALSHVAQRLGQGTQLLLKAYSLLWQATHVANEVALFGTYPLLQRVQTGPAVQVWQYCIVVQGRQVAKLSLELTIAWVKEVACGTIGTNRSISAIIAEW